jgi:hypothetical protein
MRNLAQPGFVSALLGACSAAPPAAGSGPDPSPTDANADTSGALRYVICDVKRPLAGQTTPALDASNYVPVVDGLVTNLGCNGIRLYIDPAIDDPAQYPAIYTDVLRHARHEHKLVVYANPLATGSFGKDNATFAAWIVRYANAMKPEFLGPFNESGFADADYLDIAQRVRSGLTYAPTLVGPDVQKVEGTLDHLAQTPALAAAFDTLGSHNAVGDDGATTQAWTALATAAARDTWSTENPRAWSEQSPSGQEVGVKAVVGAPVRGIVLYEAFPACVGANGQLTPKGAAISAGLVK